MEYRPVISNLSNKKSTDNGYLRKARFGNDSQCESTAKSRSSNSPERLLPYSRSLTRPRRWIVMPWSRERAGTEENRFLSLRAKAREIAAGLAEAPRLRGQLDDVKRRLKVFEESGSHRNPPILPKTEPSAARRRYLGTELGRHRTSVKRCSSRDRTRPGRRNLLRFEFRGRR